MIPLSSQTGTPRHFTSSTTSGSACLISARTRASVWPRQSSNDSIFRSMSRDAAVPDGLALFFFIAI
jgi:hypothetical protein